MDHYEYEREELEVGMEVAVPCYVTYGWQIRFRYPIWGTEKIKKLTPKKTKITLENGHIIELKKNWDGYHTRLYKHDPEMPRETSVALAFRSVLQDSKKIPNIRFSDIDDEHLIDIASKLHDVLEFVSTRKNDDEPE